MRKCAKFFKRCPRKRVLQVEKAHEHREQNVIRWITAYHRMPEANQSRSLRLSENCTVDSSKGKNSGVMTIMHHMRKLELLAQVRRKRAYTTYKQGGHKYENLLNHNSFRKSPTTVGLQILHTSSRRSEPTICAILDLHNRVYCRVSPRHRDLQLRWWLTHGEVHFARKKVADGLALHSDQGCQYTSERYFALTPKSTTLRPPCPDIGCPYDNAIMEKAAGTFKQNVFTDAGQPQATSPAACRQAHPFYNYERIDLAGLHSRRNSNRP